MPCAGNNKAAEVGDEEPSKGTGSKLHERFWPGFAAFVMVALLGLVVVVWVQVGQGAFGTKKHLNYTMTVTDNRHDDEEMTEEGDTEMPSATSQFSRISHLDDLDGFAEVEYVKPIKISPPPLHNHDIIYDQLNNNHGHPQIRHHSGHFRRKSAEVWDPHPQYEIEAFGRQLVLELAYNDHFVSPNLHILHVWENYTQRVRHNPSSLGCYYTGSVRDDESSNVAVSLCGGMTGYIKTSDGSYYIEPVEPFQEDNSSSTIMHRIKKVASSYGQGADGVPEFDLDDCETSGPAIDDDFISGVQQGDHKIVRRSINHNSEHMHLDQVHHLSSQPYFIETLVVADKYMTEYHRNEQDLFDYILTLMSHVALLFKDATVGNPINLSVVDIILLWDKDFKSVTSDEMLKKFCDWQYRNSKSKPDVSLLLTRDLICRNALKQDCSTLGIAEVGAMCNPTSSCAIVRDKGLSTSYTIAHELGHALSMPHDDDKKCFNFQGGVKPNKIMSKALQNDTKPWHWSACSKHFLTEFLDSPRSRCLLDEPKNDWILTEFPEFPSPQYLPGEKFEVNKQCELVFEAGSKLCTYMPYCSSLWCTTEYGESGGCKSLGMPWADGTSCGRDRWCHHGQCVDVNRHTLSPIAGAWGEWQEWGSCTRTCGGGIRISKRECNNPPPRNGGPYCTGGKVRYSSCNTQPCNPDRDFREEQCAFFNGNTKGIPSLTSDVEWVPKYGITNPDDYCKLYCRLRHSTAYYLLQEKVIDGTKCGLNSFDICINGICKKGGCDNQLGSNITLDECGTCGGDNSKCEVISGFYNITGTYRYNRVTTIPKGSFAIYITQTPPWNANRDENYLALRDAETDDYILNGNSVVSRLEKEINYGGLTFIYSGSDERIEYIRTPRNSKLSKDVVVEFLTVSDSRVPPDINFTYTISRDQALRYEWLFYGDKWTHCDSICSGYQYRVAACLNLVQNQIVDPNYCSSLKASKHKACNTHCNLVWEVASKNHCSADCGPGVRSVVHKCVKMSLSTDETETVDEKHCNNLPAPEAYEPCQGLCDSTRWHYDEWSECSKTCGGGEQFRNAACLDGNAQRIDDSLCNADDKNTQQLCNTEKCPSWFFGEWTPCSVTCGVGYRTKPYNCHVDNHLIDSALCDPGELRKVKEECVMAPCKPKYVRWVAGNWSECSSNCGKGTMKRAVGCMQDSHRVDDLHCQNMLRPNSTKECIDTSCQGTISASFEDNNIRSPKFVWAVGPWRQCSASCNGGNMTRRVICKSDTGITKAEVYCNSDTRPLEVKGCNTFACPDWRVSRWKKRCDHNCQQHRQVTCVDHLGTHLSEHHCDPRTKPGTVTSCKKAACLRRNIHNQNGSMYNYRNHREGGKKYGIVTSKLRWREGNWSSCSNSCGKGMMMRTVSCFDGNVAVVDAWCDGLKKPKSTKECESKNCSYLWVEGAWSECSVTCGHGKRLRNVTCHRVLQGTYTDPNALDFNPNEDYCDVYKKPSTSMSCSNSNCSDLYRWEGGPWSECSQSCGRKGRQFRKLFCINGRGDRVRKHLCPRELKPRRKKKCNEKLCVYRNCRQVKYYQRTNENKDYVLSVQGKYVQVYCYKMDTDDPEEFISLRSEQENYAMIYDKRSNNSSACPADRTTDFEDNLISYGTTEFWKVRLNITTMQIITDDFTFSRQIIGERIPYGTAGDCYSTTGNCPQGRFSIDLTGTDFRISESVRWVGQGGQHSQDIRRFSDAKISGLCGGYCGKCGPHQDLGLKVEIT